MQSRRLCAALVAALALGMTPAGARAQTAGPTTTTSGVIYLQFAQQLSDTAGHRNAFDVARAYLTVQGKFGGGIGTRVTADIYRVADGSLAYRLKYAFASWNLPKTKLSVRFGMTATPWIEWEESLWGYRMQGTVAFDRNGYLSSSDAGIAIDYTTPGEVVQLTGGVYNGENYNKAPGDRGKDVMLRASVLLAPSDEAGKVGGLRLSGYGHLGTPTGGGVRRRALGMLSWRSHRATLGLQYGVAVDSTADKARVEASVTSGFAVLRFPRSPVALVGRVDRVDPDIQADGDVRTRLIAGVSYKASPNLLLLAGVDRLSYEGGVTTPALEAVRSNALLQAQITF